MSPSRHRRTVCLRGAGVPACCLHLDEPCLQHTEPLELTQLGEIHFGTVGILINAWCTNGDEQIGTLAPVIEQILAIM
jgi:hypothetical protein